MVQDKIKRSFRERERERHTETKTASERGEASGSERVHVEAVGAC
jgi:hypothetical protein